ncbi:hypothetical protein Cgig2_031006 [Carnegiea gigantea]|uniref:Uncharacterized protein n=1 Tax=Carnegiea gigantea TaxID=171969 RepID=A0A9Q1KJX8_9CARY|nr:hypothetical protein Cgig2_031006 [Carnegiea gigantea]
MRSIEQQTPRLIDSTPVVFFVKESNLKFSIAHFDFPSPEHHGIQYQIDLSMMFTRTTDLTPLALAWNSNIKQKDGIECSRSSLCCLDQSQAKSGWRERAIWIQCAAEKKSLSIKLLLFVLFLSMYFAATPNDSERTHQDALFRKILDESYTFHFWNSLTSALVPEPDSLLKAQVQMSQCSGNVILNFKR